MAEFGLKPNVSKGKTIPHCGEYSYSVFRVFWPKPTLITGKIGDLDKFEHNTRVEKYML